MTAILFACGVLLSLCLAAASPVPVLAKNGPSVLARAEIGQPPGRDLIFRFLDLTIPRGAEPVTSVNGHGFVYVLDGVQVLTVGNEQVLLAPGQATWIGPDYHPAQSAIPGSSSHFWFIQVGTPQTRGDPPVWPYSYPNARIAFESPVFHLSDVRPRDLVLTELLLERQGATGDSLGQYGPAGVVAVQGYPSIGGQKMPLGVLLQQPGDNRQFSTSGDGMARLLAVQLVPAGVSTVPSSTQADATPILDSAQGKSVPALLPAAGDRGSAIAFEAWPLLALGGAMLLLGVLARSRTGG